MINKTKIENKKRTVKANTKKGIFRILFSRSFIFVCLLLIQLLTYFLVLSSFVFSENFKHIFFIIFSVILGFIIINKNENPMYIITWLFIILGAPVFGVFIYFFVSIQPEIKKIKKEYDKEIINTKNLLNQDKYVLEEIQNKNIYNLSNYINIYNNHTIEKYSKIKYFSSGEQKFETLKEDLSKATSFIFLEYFIIDKGFMWDTILNILIEKVKQGVEVRLMYDGTCTFSRLPTNYPKKMEELGIKCKVYSPIRPVFSTYQNNRDHRKIVIIDGNIAYTGGINLADEYINRKELYGKWKDSAIKIEGLSVKNFTLMFLQLWNLKEKTKDDYNNYLKQAQKIKSEGFICGYSDSPFDDERVGENIYLQIINNANSYLYIMTPYLIPSYEIQQALIFAAKKGIDVKIIMPHIPDKKYAFFLARVYYKTFIQNGVEIYEYTPGFVHSKVFLSDDCISTVGSINLDFRSLYLHLECGCLAYNSKEILKIKEDFSKTLKDSQKITLSFLNNLPFYQKIFGQILKLFAPLL